MALLEVRGYRSSDRNVTYWDRGKCRKGEIEKKVKNIKSLLFPFMMMMMMMVVVVMMMMVMVVAQSRKEKQIPKV